MAAILAGYFWRVFFSSLYFKLYGAYRLIYSSTAYFFKAWHYLSFAPSGVSAHS